MAINMRVSGKMAKNKEKELTIGQMEEDMTVIGLTILKREMEFSFGQMEVDMKANGIKANRMVKG
jgi:hypothetical protein